MCEHDVFSMVDMYVLLPFYLSFGFSLCHFILAEAVQDQPEINPFAGIFKHMFLQNASFIWILPILTFLALLVSCETRILLQTNSKKVKIIYRSFFFLLIFVCFLCGCVICVCHWRCPASGPDSIAGTNIVSGLSSFYRIRTSFDKFRRVFPVK